MLISIIFEDEGLNDEDYSPDLCVADIINTYNKLDYKKKLDYKNKDYHILNLKTEMLSYDQFYEYIQKKGGIRMGNQNRADAKEDLTNKIITFLQNNKTKLNTLWQPQQ